MSTCAMCHHNGQVSSNQSAIFSFEQKLFQRKYIIWENCFVNIIIFVCKGLALVCIRPTATDLIFKFIALVALWQWTYEKRIGQTISVNFYGITFRARVQTAPPTNSFEINKMSPRYTQCLRYQEMIMFEFCISFKWSFFMFKISFI